MTTIKLFGTVTSPYVRRVRVVAYELGLSCDLVDVFTDSGQAQLRERNPLWKVPSAEIDGDLVFDSRVITEYLLSAHGEGADLRPPAATDVESRNLITVIDGALDALINVFYLGRDGVQPAAASYLRKQGDRTRAAMTWLEDQVQDVWLGSEHTFGLPELALTTALGWMRFRDTYPIDEHPALLRCWQHHDARPSLTATRPPA